jgi:hypothetical protein
MGDLLGEDDALASKNILYRCLDLLLDRKAALFSHLKSRWQDLFGIKLYCQKGMKKMKEA